MSVLWPLQNPIVIIHLVQRCPFTVNSGDNIEQIITSLVLHSPLVFGKTNSSWEKTEQPCHQKQLWKETEYSKAKTISIIQCTVITYGSIDKISKDLHSYSLYSMTYILWPGLSLKRVTLHSEELTDCTSLFKSFQMHNTYVTIHHG